MKVEASDVQPLNRVGSYTAATSLLAIDYDFQTQTLVSDPLHFQGPVYVSCSRLPL